MGPHVSERIAEFVFEELSATEMVEARRHLSGCSDCREQVEQFQVTHAMLRTSVDVEPPRRIMFEFEKPRAAAPAAWLWRWLGPMAASAAVAFAVVSLTPRPAPQVVERIVPQQVQQIAAPQTQAAVAAEPVDYRKLEAWLTIELKKRDSAQAREFQRVRTDVAVLDKLLDSYQSAAFRETEENKANIQLLAQKTETR